MWFQFCLDNVNGSLEKLNDEIAKKPSMLKIEFTFTDRIIDADNYSERDDLIAIYESAKVYFNTQLGGVNTEEARIMAFRESTYPYYQRVYARNTRNMKFFGRDVGQIRIPLSWFTDESLSVKRTELMKMARPSAYDPVAFFVHPLFGEQATPITEDDFVNVISLIKNPTNTVGMQSVRILTRISVPILGQEFPDPTVHDISKPIPTSPTSEYGEMDSSLHSSRPSNSTSIVPRAGVPGIRPPPHDIDGKKASNYGNNSQLNYAASIKFPDDDKSSSLFTDTRQELDSPPPYYHQFFDIGKLQSSESEMIEKIRTAKQTLFDDLNKIDNGLINNEMINNDTLVETTNIIKRDIVNLKTKYDKLNSFCIDEFSDDAPNNRHLLTEISGIMHNDGDLFMNRAKSQTEHLRPGLETLSNELHKMSADLHNMVHGGQSVSSVTPQEEEDTLSVTSVSPHISNEFTNIRQQREEDYNEAYQKRQIIGQISNHFDNIKKDVDIIIEQMTNEKEGAARQWLIEEKKAVIQKEIECLYDLSESAAEYGNEFTTDILAQYTTIICDMAGSLRDTKTRNKVVTKLATTIENMLTDITSHITQKKQDAQHSSLLNVALEAAPRGSKKKTE